MNVKVKKSIKFDRDENVQVHVRRLVLDEGTEVIEIREWLKSGEVWGHGVLIPIEKWEALYDAISKVLVG